MIEGTRVDANGDAVSLSGLSISSQMVRSANRVALSVVIVDAAAGRFNLSLTAAQTADLAVGSWISDVEFRDPSGNVVSSDTYTIFVVQDVTNGSG